VRSPKTRRGRRILTSIVILAGVLAAACESGGEDDRGEAPHPAADAPNIVVVMTDDQTVESMRVLPQVDELLAAEGVTFTRNVVSFPVCCPSRATFLTGQYMHNHGVRGNLPPHGGYGAFKDQETALPVALQRAGSNTILVGKYLNGYGTVQPVEVPPGWTEWNGAIDPSTYKYVGFTLLQDGQERTFEDQYQTDVYTELATDAIRRHAEGDAPFMLTVAYLAPHAEVEEGEEDAQGAAEPAARDLGTFDGEGLPTDPAYDEADVTDKPGAIVSLPRISAEVKAEITTNYHRYLESLLAVDEGVDQIVGALEDTGELDDTVVIFTSDNGFLFGEHRIPSGKVWFYDQSILVPLVVRGPGFERGTINDALVGNVDLAPTILELAGAEPLRTMDGVSLVPLLEGGAGPPDRAILLESGGPYSPNDGLRTERYAYFEQGTGEIELYDLQTDPSQLDNRHDDPALASAEAELSERLARLRSCAGETCR
jgi:N-acetylglucosamine-6-sulfatase